MESYRDLREEMVRLTEDVRSLLEKPQQLPTLNPQLLAEAQAAVMRILKQLGEEVLRVAVVGSIKSGKSTFVNSLLGADVTQRGAGVVTSIVTRIRAGKSLVATLFFKSWEEVNADIQQALSLVTERGGQIAPEPFDIQNEAHRTWALDHLSRLGTDRLIRDGLRHPSAVLIQAYLAGFDEVKPLLSSSEGSVHRLTGERFHAHRTFTGNDHLAVYLKDVRLEVPQESLDPHVEIADCQGSDSPNPLHLVMIQDYLVMTHLIVYVVSSRTGLREADIRFLSMIRKMGIMDNILFVINCDFNEHESAESMQPLLERNIRELSLIKPDPETYCFSCLYNLFKSQSSAGIEDQMAPKDRERLLFWEKETAFIRFSDSQSAKFIADFTHHLTQRRYALLLNNHVSRLRTILSGLSHAVILGRDLLTRDLDSAMAFRGRLADHHKSVQQLSQMVQNTLGGASDAIKKQLRQGVDRLFDPTGGIVREVLEFTRNYDHAAPNCTASDAADPFSAICSNMIQEFRGSLDSRMAETLNPAIIQSIKEMEALILNGFKTVSRPVQGMVEEAVSNYNETLCAFGIPAITHDTDRVSLPDLEEIKEADGIHLLPAQAVLGYSGKIRTEAVVRFNLYRLYERISAFFKRNRDISTTQQPTDRALRDSLSKVKRETTSALLSHFKDYRENLKFQYLFKLVDAVSGRLLESFTDGFRVYGTDIEKTLSLMGDQKGRKDSAKEALSSMGPELEILNARIGELERRIRAADTPVTLQDN